MQSTQTLDLLKIKHPIIQGPFGGGLSTVEMVSTVSNLGGLGSFGVHYLEAEGILGVASEIREKTSNPFALNLWVSDHDPEARDYSTDAYDRAWRLFEPLYRELNLPKPEQPPRFHPSFEEQVEAILEAQPDVFSFVFGIPPARVLADCKARGITTVGAATTLAEAQALEAADVDVILATGFEAGGHWPSFLDRAEDSLMGTMPLPVLSQRCVQNRSLRRVGLWMPGASRRRCPSVRGPRNWARRSWPARNPARWINIGRHCFRIALPVQY